jgi:hypothetical protein
MIHSTIDRQLGRQTQHRDIVLVYDPLPTRKIDSISLLRRKNIVVRVFLGEKKNRERKRDRERQRGREAE